MHRYDGEVAAGQGWGPRAALGAIVLLAVVGACTRPSATEAPPEGTEVLLAQGTEEDEEWSSTIVQMATEPCLHIRVGLPGLPPGQTGICRSSLSPGSHVGGFNYVDGYRPALLVSGVVSTDVDRVVLRLTCGAPPVTVDLSPQSLHAFSVRFYSVVLPLGARVYEVAGISGDGRVLDTATSGDTTADTPCLEPPPPIELPTAPTPSR